ncbi:MAG: hypothetical protein HY327_01205, partial [Chloroflexi bacterium]|nr:hypothetical protein [Chloroflexota bacterium]
MTAFVTFIKTYAVWIYLLSGVGILIVAKMLFDARRLARTTFFSLDQERAGEQYYRGIALLLFLILMVCSVTAINVFVAPAIPSPESPVVRVATPTFVVTFPAIPSVLPTNTLVAKVTDAAVPNTPSIAIPAVTRTPTKPPAPPA